MRNTGGGNEAASAFIQNEARFAHVSPSKAVQMDLQMPVVNTHKFYVPWQLN